MASPYTRQHTFVEGSTTDPSKVNEEFSAIKGAMDQMESDLSLAEQWATEDEDVVVSGAEYSAKHYALKSEASATAAANSESAAGTSASNSATSKSGAEAAQAECESLLTQCQSAASDAVQDSIPGIMLRAVSKSINSASVIGTKINAFYFSDDSSRILAAGNTGKLAYSDTDGMFWTACTHGFGSNNVVGIVKMTGGKWYALASTGRLEESADGITFTLSTTLSIGTAAALAVSGDKICAVGSTGAAAKVEGGSFSTFSPGFACTKVDGCDVYDYSTGNSYVATTFLVGGYEDLYEVKYQSSSWAGRALINTFSSTESCTGVALTKLGVRENKPLTTGPYSGVPALAGFVAGDAGTLSNVSQCMDAAFRSANASADTVCTILGLPSSGPYAAAPYSLSNAVRGVCIFNELANDGSEGSTGKFLVALGDKTFRQGGFYIGVAGLATEDNQFISLEGSGILTSELSAMNAGNGVILLGSSTGADPIEILRYDV